MRKMNTVPGGIGIITVLFFDFLLVAIIGLSLLYSDVAVAVVLLSLCLLLPIPILLSQKYWNFIYISDSGVRNGKDQFDWDSVYVTVKHVTHSFTRNTIEYNIYFDDHYLTLAETKSRKIKKKGFYLVLTSKRTDYILQYYQKPIRLLNKTSYRGNKKILEIIQTHNKKYIAEIE